jgi:hypothetical protein
VLGAVSLATVMLGLVTVKPTVSPAAPLSFSEFGISAVEESGLPDGRAGSHPYGLTVNYSLATHFNEEIGVAEPDGGQPKKLTVDFPPGLVINPTATPVRCTDGRLIKQACPLTSAVGVAVVRLEGFELLSVPVYNMVAPPGAPGEVAFNPENSAIVDIAGRVRTGQDYGISGDATELTQKGGVLSAKVTLWGAPASPAHDSERGQCVLPQEKAEGATCPVERCNIEFLNSECPGGHSEEIPFITLPSQCESELSASIRTNTWQEPSVFAEAAAASHGPNGELVGVGECDRLRFDPTISVKPQSQYAETPSGFEIDLHVPQIQSSTGLAESTLRDATVTLPAGVSVSPSAANGLTACSQSQIDLSGSGPAQCPPSSEVGTVAVKTPLLAEELIGGVYVAQQNANPFGSLLAIYVVAEGSGVVVKLAGHVEVDAVTGQVTTRFSNAPQLPFSELKMVLHGGANAALTTPSGCGTYTTNTALTPWSLQIPDELSDSFAISSGCGGGFAPSFSAGTTNNQAAAHSPFTLAFARHDGERDFKGLEASLPAGLLARLAGVPLCGDGEANAGSCSEASRIGTVVVGAGAGPDPVDVTGGVYLTGPYNGGPFGEVVEVPAVAGPFNLGMVVVRGSIRINPVTAQASVVSDSFPTILDGVPLQVKTVNVRLDRPVFTLNPTNCSPMSVTATISSTQGARALVSSPFEAANCAALAFRPSFKASTEARTSKAAGASLTVRVVPGAGQANIAKVDLELPKRLPARLTTLQKACTEAQFNTNPAGCPEASVIGMAKAITPLLNGALVGPAYLVSHGGAAFPDVEFILQGEGVTIMLDGKTQIKKGVTYSHFETVPDAPISSFETVLPEGQHSVLATDIPASAKHSLCGLALNMPTTITGQNGAVLTQTTKAAVSGCTKAKARALTRAQKLAEALKACRKDNRKAKRVGCERQARRKFRSRAKNKRKGKTDKQKG